MLSATDLTLFIELIRTIKGKFAINDQLSLVFEQIFFSLLEHDIYIIKKKIYIKTCYNNGKVQPIIVFIMLIIHAI